MFNFLETVSLSSWDEAWYGSIAKSMLQTGDLFNLTFNTKPFFDHPPLVIWLQALVMRFIGVNEIAVRLPGFLLGLMTIFCLFLLGKEIFNRWVGIFAGISLLSAPWFVSRSLSGNLDIPLTFLFVLTFYLAIKFSKNNSYLIPFSISLSALFLTKSLVPFTIVPCLALILYKKISFKQIIYVLSIFSILVLPWFIVNLLNNPSFVNRYLSIGYPGEKSILNIWQNILLTKTYLHSGIGNIFVYGLLGLFFGTIFYFKKYLYFLVFIAIFLLPFAFSNKGHIWHLIPIYPFWILSFWGLVSFIFKKYQLLIMPLLFILLLFNQTKKNWFEIVRVPSYVSDLEILATKSKEYDYPLYLDDDAVPEVVFYSNKKVTKTFGRDSLRNLFSEKDNFLLITRDWRLVEEKINTKEYTLVVKDRDKVLVLKKK